jgi:ketosteroid isomerase-like protein
MSQNDITKEVEAAATAFLTAFDKLEWELFCAAIAQDATFFMPWPSFPDRLDGRAQIEQAFRPLFTELPQKKAGPFYLDLHPTNLAIQVFGESAVVTFHLAEVDHYGRRTAVFAKRGEQWLLVHLHASNMPPKS